ncbi:Uncharacterised protein [Serratia proteamaculans]|nr:Uncharacterised protein [Serratia proteamaculans]CAI0818192.1 Uncharacterised protein [Serratia proteamaculans]CAI0819742.1 Uncharacterised protein [Serratia proteamaculans]CAI2067993.1 Uncharacterised protein [Serratia proteamaculans]CAI2423230.1 Uncharacterised protein [Serratia proteamaculans]
MQCFLVGYLDALLYINMYIYTIKIKSTLIKLTLFTL